MALHLIVIYWIVRHGFISEEESLCIARQYLGKRHNRANISKVFSEKSTFSPTGCLIPCNNSFLVVYFEAFNTQRFDSPKIPRYK
jgi:hypothetical protein